MRQTSSQIQPDFNSLIPSDMEQAANDLITIYKSPMPEDFQSSLFCFSLCNANLPEKTSKVSKKTDKNKELSNKIDKERSKSKKKKHFTQFTKKSTSYRKLVDLYNLESDITSHFILNHKYKIIPCGSASAVQHVSDDEGTESRNGNPLYNVDIVNNKFDELSEQDAQSEQSIFYELKDYLQDSQKLKQLRKTTVIPEELLQSIYQDRHLFLNAIFEYNSELTKFPIVKPVNFDINDNLNTSNAIPFPEFLLILTVLMNVQVYSTSMRIGTEIQDNLSSLKMLIFRSMKVKQLRFKHHLVCQKIFSEFLFITFDLIYSLWKSLSLPQHWEFTLLTSFFTEKDLCLCKVLDEITSELAKSIDNGGFYSREFLKYREISCIAYLNSFSSLIQQECDRYEESQDCELSHLIRIARGYGSFSPLFGININFNQNGEIYLSRTPVEIPPFLPKFLFPIFNMFDGLISTDDESLQQLIF